MGNIRLGPGVVIDGFTLGDLIHTGGMAVLYSVAHPDHDMPLIMKVPRLAEGDDPEAIVGFEMEQMILPRVSGVHVPLYVAQGDFTVQPYIVMERIQGDPLIKRLPDLPLPAEEVASLGAKMAMALADLHRQRVVHNDVKPSNVMLRTGGEVAFVDFGLACHDELPDLVDEEFHIPIGTAPYMSPEQIRRVRNDPRSDLYSLGVLLYFFATGERPFGEPRGQRAVNRRLWRDPMPPRAINKAVPPWLQEVILRCLETDPAQRHPTAAQLALDLRNPSQVRLTERAQRLHRDNWFKVWARRVAMQRSLDQPITRPVAAQVASAPIVVAAIDLSPEMTPLDDSMRLAVHQIMAGLKNARLACLNVLKQNMLSPDETLDEQGRNKHVQRLVELQHWARPLGLPEERVTFHVLEAIDPAAAIIDYATINRADHVVMGARGSGTLRRYLGSTSTEVVSRAPCSVTVVRRSQVVEA
jgi:serine/threonine protein kinase